MQILHRLSHQGSSTTYTTPFSCMHYFNIYYPPCLHWPPVFIYPTFSIYCFITRRNFSNHLILTPDQFVRLCLHHASETGFYICLVTATEVSSVWSRLPGRIAGEYWERFQHRWDKINPCLLHSIHGTLTVVRAFLPGLGVGKQWVPTPKKHNLMIIPCGVISLLHECLSKKKKKYMSLEANVLSL